MKIQTQTFVFLSWRSHCDSGRLNIAAHFCYENIEHENLEVPERRNNTKQVKVLELETILYYLNAFPSYLPNFSAVENFQLVEY